jgi:hypothetical protein
MIKQVAWNKSSLILEDTKVKHTNIATIYKGNLQWKVYIKVIKMSRQKAWVQRPSGPMKVRDAQALLRETILLKVKNVALK